MLRLVTSNKREFLIWHCINYQTLQPHDQISSTVKMTQVRTLNILCVWCDPHNKRFRCILLVNILRPTCERALKFIASRGQHLQYYIVKFQSVIVQTMTCYRQTCTQIITGRNLNYRRALKVVQNEEYLMVTDLEIIRRLYEGGIQIKFKLVFHRILKKKIEGEGCIAIFWIRFQYEN